MADIKVLVVDDSLTMRALISRVLETLPGITVVGAANGADEARAEVVRLKPDIMTLDIEMPGMNGIEYLAELMDSRPMPVIMFSTRTEAGASSSIEALRLGAIDCFPKPKAASQTEFDAILGKLGSFPANCPPTLVIPHLGAELIDSLISRLNEQSAATVIKAQNALTPEQGKIYVTQPGAAHFGIDKWPGGQIRQMTRDPLAGERPSISLMFAAQAKAAGDQAIGIMLSDAGEDGKAGLGALLKAGGHVLAPASLLSGVPDQTDYILRQGDSSEVVSWGNFAAKALGLCSK